jgi:DNA repair exonuclease SbcCD ATPase subunit
MPGPVADPLGELRKQQQEEAAARKAAEQRAAALQDDLKALESSTKDSEQSAKAFEAKFEGLGDARTKALRGIDRLKNRIPPAVVAEAEKLVERRKAEEQKDATDERKKLAEAQQAAAAPDPWKLDAAQRAYDAVKASLGAVEPRIKEAERLIKAAEALESDGKGASAWYNAAWAREILTDLKIPTPAEARASLKKARDAVGDARKAIRDKKSDLAGAQAALDVALVKIQVDREAVMADLARQLEDLDEGVGGGSGGGGTPAATPAASRAEQGREATTV